MFCTSRKDAGVMIIIIRRMIIMSDVVHEMSHTHTSYYDESYYIYLCPDGAPHVHTRLPAGVTSSRHLRPFDVSKRSQLEFGAE